MDTFLRGKRFLSTSAIVCHYRFERVSIHNRHLRGYRMLENALAVPIVHLLSSGLAFLGLMSLSGLRCNVLENTSSAKCGYMSWIC